jgi:hypothetical protein
MALPLILALGLYAIPLLVTAIAVFIAAGEPGHAFVSEQTARSAHAIEAELIITDPQQGKPDRSCPYLALVQALHR